MTITVRKLNAQTYFVSGVERVDHVYVGTKVWTIWADGKVVRGWYVSETSVGLTVIRPYRQTNPSEKMDPRLPTPSLAMFHGTPVVHVMATVWHAGITPGDLARLVMGKILNPPDPQQERGSNAQNVPSGEPISTDDHATAAKEAHAMPTISPLVPVNAGNEASAMEAIRTQIAKDGTHRLVGDLVVETIEPTRPFRDVAFAVTNDPEPMRCFLIRATIESV